MRLKAVGTAHITPPLPNIKGSLKEGPFLISRRIPESWLAMKDNYDLWQARKSANLSQVRKVPFEATV